jgi:hypothetical protein
LTSRESSPDVTIAAPYPPTGGYGGKIRCSKLNPPASVS